MTGTTLLVATLQQATLTGVVRDSVALEPVAFAPVAVAPAGGGATPAVRTSDRFGAFVVPAVPAAGPVRIEVRAFGYAVWTRTYDPLPAEPLRVLLSPAPIELEGLRAAVSGRGGDPMSLSRGAFVIDSVLLRSLPTILETDVLRAMAVAPSASQLSDYVAIPFTGRHQRRYARAPRRSKALQRVSPGRLRLRDQRRSGRSRDPSDGVGR